MQRLTSPRMARLLLNLLGVTLLALSLAQPALAHPGHGAAGAGLLAGLLHPLLGLDHAVLLLAVGLWIALRRTDPQRRPLPARHLPAAALALLGVMALGALAGQGGWLPGVGEGAVASLLVVLGVPLALAVQPPRALALALVSLSVLLHGVVHGAAFGGAPASFAFYLGGLLATSGALIAMGIGLARAAAPARLRSAIVPALGVCVAALGVAGWLF